MRHRLHATPLAVVILGLAATAFGQQAQLHGTVFDNGGKVVSSVRVIVAGAQAINTESNGRFTVSFSNSVLPGEATRIQVDGWTVFDPIFGETWTQSRERGGDLRVTIVRPGSVAAHLKRERLAVIVDKFQKDLNRQARAIEALRSKEQYELQKYAFLQRYEQEYGIPWERLKDALDEWAQIKDLDDKLIRVNQETWAGNWDEVRRLTAEAAPTSIELLKRRNRQRAREGLEDSRRAISYQMAYGNSFFASANFTLALEAFEQLEALFESEDLEKKDLPEHWADVKQSIGAAKAELAKRSLGTERLRLQTEAVTAFRDAQTVFTRERSVVVWASLENNIGNALRELAEFRDLKGRTELLEQSADSFRKILAAVSPSTAPRLWAWTQSDLSWTLRLQAELRGPRDGASLHDQSIDALQQALTVFTRDRMPDGWAAVQANLGQTFKTWGMLHEGKERERLLAQALDSFEKVITVFTREAFPEKWAAGQVDLANTLANWGESLEGDKSAELLARAVDSYRRALSVFTRETRERDWAATQNNLGLALRSRAERRGGDDERRLMAEAVESFREALKVYTRELSPREWLAVQGNLAVTLTSMEDWPNALKSFNDILAFEPRNQAALLRAALIYQHVLYDYAEAFRLVERLVKEGPGPPEVQALFAEMHFTVGRFAECEQRISSLLAQPGLDAGINTGLRAIEIANLLAMGKATLVRARIDALITTVASQPADFQQPWSFLGVNQFVSQNDKLTPHRVWLRQVFDALAGEDRGTMLKALQAARANLKEER
jgi:tetratricopeptide (TPR) repeat protein